MDRPRQIKIIQTGDLVRINNDDLQALIDTDTRSPSLSEPT